MKISKSTVDVLKNFASINPSMLFTAGTELKTVSPQKTVFAKVKIEDTIDTEFGVFDLSQFIGVLSDYENPDITVNDTFISISNGSGDISDIVRAKAELLPSLPTKEVTLPSVDVAFVLEAAKLQRALRQASLLALPEIALLGEHGNAYFCAIDSRSDSTNRFKSPVGTAEKNYKMIFKVDNLKVMGGKDYDVKVSSKGIAYFASTDDICHYWVATESGSSFDA